MPTLYDSLHWQRLPLAGTAAAPELQLGYGEVGTAAPRVLLTAGIHGDEGPWSALAIRTLLQQPKERLRGSLRVVLTANPLAAQADTRNAPTDGLDLNRTFPGAAEGSHSERLAASLAPLISGSDVVIDLHGGGSWCVNAFTFRFPGSEALAREVGAPFVVDAPEKQGTLTQYARSHGAEVVAVEMGGRSRDEMRWCKRLAESLLRVLTSCGALEPQLPPTPAPVSVPVGPSRVLRPPVGGVFVPTVREEAVGTVVPGGSELGRLLDLGTLETRAVFHAPFERTALLLLRPHIGILEGGAMTYVVAEPRKER